MEHKNLKGHDFLALKQDSALLGTFKNMKS